MLWQCSLKFTKTTVQFFFELTDAGSPDKFPLYSESIKFIRNKDGMVTPSSILHLPSLQQMQPYLVADNT